jgi:hypothetical protein
LKEYEEYKRTTKHNPPMSRTKYEEYKLKKEQNQAHAEMKKKPSLWEKAKNKWKTLRHPSKQTLKKHSSKKHDPSNPIKRITLI